MISIDNKRSEALERREKRRRQKADNDSNDEHLSRENNGEQSKKQKTDNAMQVKGASTIPEVDSEPLNSPSTIVLEISTHGANMIPDAYNDANKPGEHTPAICSEKLSDERDVVQPPDSMPTHSREVTSDNARIVRGTRLDDPDDDWNLWSCEQVGTERRSTGTEIASSSNDTVNRAAAANNRNDEPEPARRNVVTEGEPECKRMAANQDPC